jgi:nitrogen fixation protein NifU and related proteins
MELDSLYQEVILDHYRNPLHKKLLSDFSAKVHHVNPSCGDEIDLTLKTNQGTITDIGWDGIGCSISQASVSIASDLLIGKSEEEALSLIEDFNGLMHSKGTEAGDEVRLEDAIALAGVSKFPARVKCALLGWMAIKDSLARSTMDANGEERVRS